MSYYSNRRYNPPAELKVAPHGAAPISTGMMQQFKVFGNELWCRSDPAWVAGSTGLSAMFKCKELK